MVSKRSAHKGSHRPVLHSIRIRLIFTSVTGTDGCSSASSVLDYIYTGINNLNLQNSNLKIYPNPSNGSFTIEFGPELTEDLRLNILNALGENIYTGILPKGNKSLQLLLNGSVQSGIYTIKLYGNSGTDFFKIIIDN